MSQPMASTDAIAVDINCAGGEGGPVKKVPVAKKGARTKGGPAAAGGDDFNFKFGFNFQSPAKTIRCVVRLSGVGGMRVFRGGGGKG